MAKKTEVVITSPISEELHIQLSNENEVGSKYVGDMAIQDIVDLIRSTEKIVVTGDRNKALEINKRCPQTRIICFDLNQIKKELLLSSVKGKLSYQNIFESGDIIWIPTPI